MITRQQIIKKLEELEKKHNITIMLAVEAGSRAWGFSSTDSDYDIRGYYKYNDIEVYYNAEEKEQIELMEGELDICLWDIRKFSTLLYKSNPSISEWLSCCNESSQSIYFNYSTCKMVNDLFEITFNKESLIKYYESMAKQNYFKYIKDKEKVTYKRYLYVLRSIGCAEYIKKNNKRPPLNYKKLKLMFPKKIWTKFDKIAIAKKNNEKYEAESDKELDTYILTKLQLGGKK